MTWDERLQEILDKHAEFVRLSEIARDLDAPEAARALLEAYQT